MPIITVGDVVYSTNDIQSMCEQRDRAVARVAELERAMSGLLGWAEGSCNDCDGHRGRGGGGDHEPDCAQAPMVNACRRALGQPEIEGVPSVCTERAHELAVLRDDGSSRCPNYWADRARQCTKKRGHDGEHDFPPAQRPSEPEKCGWCHFDSHGETSCGDAYAQRASDVWPACCKRQGIRPCDACSWSQRTNEALTLAERADTWIKYIGEPTPEALTLLLEAVRDETLEGMHRSETPSILIRFADGVRLWVDAVEGSREESDAQVALFKVLEEYDALATLTGSTPK